MTWSSFCPWPLQWKLCMGRTAPSPFYPGSSSCCSSWMADLLAVEAKAELLMWHRPSRTSASLSVAIRLHQVPYTLERAMCYPYQNCCVSYNLPFLPAGPRSAPLSEGSQSNWFTDMRSWLIINEPTLQQRSMAVRAWPGIYWFYHIQHEVSPEDASLIGFLKAQLRN